MWYISLLNNGLKIIAKIIANRISKYGIDEGFIRPEQYGFRNRLRIILERNFQNKNTICYINIQVFEFRNVLNNIRLS